MHIQLQQQLRNYAFALCDNLDKLLTMFNHSVSSKSTSIGRGKVWQTAKAMSSAISRQCPTFSNVLVQTEVLCPQPEMKECESRRTHALSLYVSGVDFDQELDDENDGDGGVGLHSAARDVAKSLQDVLMSLNIVA